MIHLLINRLRDVANTTLSKWDLVIIESDTWGSSALSALGFLQQGLVQLRKRKVE